MKDWAPRAQHLECFTMAAALLFQLALFGAGLVQEVTPPETLPHTAQPAVDPQVDAILTDLERVGSEVRDLRCRLEYKVTDNLNFDQYTKIGQILFKEGDPNPRFHIQFSERIQGDVKSRDREWWLFDGRWLWEVNETASQAFKREVVAPGEKVDLFDIETAPFPVPFGQKKDQILTHFDVTLVSPKSGDPENTDHLRCVPKPGSRLGDDYDVLEFFILKDLHLPRRITATEKQEVKTVTSDFPDLSEKSVNSGLKDKEFEPLGEWEKFGAPIVETLKKDPDTPQGGSHP